jgi:hypothetical protein
MELVMALICCGCGCTNEQACPGGCSWVSLKPPLCSACVEMGTEAALEAADIATASVEVDDVFCPASPIPAPHRPIWTDAHNCHCVNCRAPLAA